jgi:hypothetical protein
MFLRRNLEGVKIVHSSSILASFLGMPTILKSLLRILIMFLLSPRREMRVVGVQLLKTRLPPSWLIERPGVYVTNVV